MNVTPYFSNARVCFSNVLIAFIVKSLSSLALFSVGISRLFIIFVTYFLNISTE